MAESNTPRDQDPTQIIDNDAEANTKFLRELLEAEPGPTPDEFLGMMAAQREGDLMRDTGDKAGELVDTNPLVGMQVELSGKGNPEAPEGMYVTSAGGVREYFQAHRSEMQFEDVPEVSPDGAHVTLHNRDQLRGYLMAAEKRGFDDLSTTDVADRVQDMIDEINGLGATGEAALRAAGEQNLFGLPPELSQTVADILLAERHAATDGMVPDFIEREDASVETLDDIPTDAEGLIALIEQGEFLDNPSAEAIHNVAELVRGHFEATVAKIRNGEGIDAEELADNLHSVISAAAALIHRDTNGAGSATRGREFGATEIDTSLFAALEAGYNAERGAIQDDALTRRTHVNEIRTVLNELHASNGMETDRSRSMRERAMDSLRGVVETIDANDASPETLEQLAKAGEKSAEIMRQLARKIEVDQQLDFSTANGERKFHRAAMKDYIQRHAILMLKSISREGAS